MEFRNLQTVANIAINEMRHRYELYGYRNHIIDSYYWPNADLIDYYRNGRNIGSKVTKASRVAAILKTHLSYLGEKRFRIRDDIKQFSQPLASTITGYTGKKKKRWLQTKIYDIDNITKLVEDRMYANTGLSLNQLLNIPREFEIWHKKSHRNNFDLEYIMNDLRRKLKEKQIRKL